VISLAGQPERQPNLKKPTALRGAVGVWDCENSDRIKGPLPSYLGIAGLCESRCSSGFKSKPGGTSRPSERKRRKSPKSTCKPCEACLVWQALWIGFNAFGVARHDGCWRTRTWVARSLRRDGAHNTCTKLKDLAVSIRGYVLSDVRPDYVPGLPVKIQRWLRKCTDNDSLSGLAFTRFARALPKPNAKTVSAAYLAHLELLSDRVVVPPGVCEQISTYVAGIVRGKFVERKLHINAPISNHAVGERPKARGGYNAYIYSRAEDPEFLLGADYSATAPKLGLLGRSLWRQAVIPGDGLLSEIVASRALPAIRAVEAFYEGSHRDDFTVVHNATAIGEQGDKCRIITVPPGDLFAAGDLCRQRTWPVVSSSDSRLFGGSEDAKSRLAGIGLASGEVYVSADLTKATDGFAHDAVRAVLQGLRRAGLDPHTVDCMAETLGVGRRLHYVKYKLADLPRRERHRVEERFKVVSGEKGGEYVLVPMVRGILMGTPCSFTILSLLNGWCAKPLGSKTVICGDDVGAACTPESVLTYKLRTEIVGSGMHERKTFIGHRGLLFCEMYVLPEFKDARCFEPVPLKSLAKDGDGTIDTSCFDSFIWRRMDRVCRVLWKSVRAKARRLGRWPQLPIELGGLGHPSNGRMGAVPGSMRNRLATLIKGDVPMKPVKVWKRSPQPLDWRSAESDKERAWEFFENSIATISELEAGEGSERSFFVSYREARSYVSIMANEFYCSHGGRFKSHDQIKLKPGDALYPAVGSLQYSKKAPMSMVAREYIARLEAEGEYLPYDAVRKIRARTHKSGWSA